MVSCAAVVCHPCTTSEINKVPRRPAPPQVPIGVPSVDQSPYDIRHVLAHPVVKRCQTKNTGSNA